MNTHTIPDKLRIKIDQMYSGPDKERVIKALESGKTVYIGGVKLQGAKADTAAMTGPTALSVDTKTDSKSSKDKDK